MTITQLSCCGLIELAGISHHDTPREVLVAAKTDNLHRYMRGGVIFSDHSRGGMARPLAAYIKAHDYGRVTQVPPFLNNNSGNNLVAFVWIPNPKWFRRSITRL